MSDKITRIEISFAEPVELPPGFDHALSTFINLVCERYQEQNPTRVMWPAEHGSRPKWSAGEIAGFDNVKRGAWDLIFLVLRQALAGRNR